MIMTVRIFCSCAISAMLALAAAVPVSAQTRGADQVRQKAQVDHLRDTVRSNALHEQQSQQSSRTTAKAFQSTRAKAQLQSADQARYDRYSDAQRTAIDDFQSKQAAQPAEKHPQSKPAHASSTH